MRKLTWVYICLSLAGLVLLAGLVYQYPPLNRRLTWPIMRVQSYVRGALDPIEAVPSPLPKSEQAAASSPASTATLAPTPTAIPTVQVTPTRLPSPTPLPTSVVLTAPRWEKQDINNCGPASLAMYLRFYGWEGGQSDIADLLKPFPRTATSTSRSWFTTCVRGQAG